MESFESIMQRLRNCERTIRRLKELEAPQDAIDNAEEVLESIKNSIKNRQDYDLAMQKLQEENIAARLEYEMNKSKGN